MNTESTTPQAATTAHRYAVYFAPSPGTLGWLAGSHWLGRCAAQLRPLPQLDIHGVAPADLQRLTAAPRRYGWHATLKGPFALAPGTDWLTLHHAVQQVADTLQRVRAAVNLEAVNGFPAHEGGEQPAKPENVVEVSVGDEDAVEALKADAGLQDLALGTLAAVDQEAVLILLDEVGGQVALGGGG